MKNYKEKPKPKTKRSGKSKKKGLDDDPSHVSDTSLEPKKNEVQYYVGDYR